MSMFTSYIIFCWFWNLDFFFAQIVVYCLLVTKNAVCGPGTGKTTGQVCCILVRK